MLLERDGDAVLERIGGIEEIGAFPVHPGAASDAGNDFAVGQFLIENRGPAVEFANLEALTHFTWLVRQELTLQGITGDYGMEIDHIEVIGPPSDPTVADSRNFVLCPGKAYDRSPCGTGTSAKIACLHAAGKLKPGQIWRQASILDTVFSGWVDQELPDGKIIPRVAGRAWVNGESTYFLDPADPFQHGIPVPF